MTRPRRRLRTRLLVAMMAIALGVLVLTALVTAGLARRSEVTTARHDVQDRAEVVAPEFDKLIRQLPAAQVATGTLAGRRQVRRIRDLVNTTLRASNGAVVAVDANGDVQEVLGRLLGTAGATPTLPDGVTIDELDTTTLLAGSTQNGRDGNTVFVAEPLDPVGEVTPVLVLAEDVNTRPFGGSGLAVLGAAAIALGIAAFVAAYLARRMTRPLAAMETTARSIAGGDLSARVDTTDVPDDELASLAHAINAMAADLDVARGARARLPPQRVARPAHAVDLDPRLRRGHRRRHRRGQGRPHPGRRRDLVGVPPAGTPRRRPARPRPPRRAPVLAASRPGRRPGGRARRGRGVRPAAAELGLALDVERGRHRARGRRRATAGADRRQPGGERAQVRDDARRRRRGGRRRPRRAARRRRRGRHRAAGTSPTSSSASTRPAPSRDARWGPASASRSCTNSRWRWAATRASSRSTASAPASW